ncbi:MAG: AI-2E family transporter [Rhizobacter sp.]|nr:AI-2E family transporter [Rhizobacter sp.]
MPIDKVQQAAAELEQAAHAAEASAASAAAAAAASVPASAAASAPKAEGARPRAAAAREPRSASAIETIVASPSRAVTHVVVERPGFSFREYLWSGTIGVFVFLGQLAIVLFVTLFLLASGDTFRRKMVKLAGPRLSQKKITVQALDEVSLQIQRYLLVTLATSVVLGVAAGVTNLIPYLGALVLGFGSALAGFIQFDSIQQALLVGASTFALHGVIGNLLTPWWTGRASRMSPFAVFVGVLAFGWLWGPAGLILGTPILMVTKTVCDRVDELRPVGEFLGA